MNEFLKGLRSNGKDKRYDKNTRKPYNPQYNNSNPQYNNSQHNGTNPQYYNPQYRGNEDVNGNLKQMPPADMERLADLLEEAMPDIKLLLKSLAENQIRLADAEDRRAKAEEHKAEMMESIAECVKTFLASGAGLPLMNMSLPGDAAASVPELISDHQKKNTPDRQAVLNTIFSMRENGATYGRIASHLESESIPTFSGKGKWHAQTIQRICRKGH